MREGRLRTMASILPQPVYIRAGTRAGCGRGTSFGTLDWFTARLPGSPAMTLHTGRHFLQIPGPTNVPDRVLRAIDAPTIDHRGPEFAPLGIEVLRGMQHVFQTRHPVVIYPASGTGAWEAALVNTLSPGDRVLMYETGHFATLWRRMAGQARARRRVHRRRLAPRRRSRPRSRRRWPPIARTRSRRCASSTTKPRPAR